jgi:hypothetical protein
MYKRSGSRRSPRPIQKASVPKNLPGAFFALLSLSTFLQILAYFPPDLDRLVDLSRCAKSRNEGHRPILRLFRQQRRLSHCIPHCEIWEVSGPCRTRPVDSLMQIRRSRMPGRRTLCEETHAERRRGKQLGYAGTRIEVRYELKEGRVLEAKM